MVALVAAIVLLWGDRILAKIKDGVSFGGELKQTTVAIIRAAEYAFGKYGITPVITSAVDGVHMDGSRHYTGDALDLRRWDSDKIGKTDAIAQELRTWLGRDYDVVVEADHIHVEYDPKG